MNILRRFSRAIKPPKDQLRVLAQYLDWRLVVVDHPVGFFRHTLYITGTNPKTGLAVNHRVSIAASVDFAAEFGVLFMGDVLAKPLGLTDAEANMVASKLDVVGAARRLDRGNLRTVDEIMERAP